MKNIWNTASVWMTPRRAWWFIVFLTTASWVWAVMQKSWLMFGIGLFVLIFGGGLCWIEQLFKDAEDQAQGRRSDYEN